MKVSFMSGAYKNAGDFLIERRSIELLKYVYPNIEIKKYLRNQLEEKFDKINNADAIIFGGGPLYQKNLEGYLPLEKCLNKITAPIMILGCGWYGIMDGSAIVYRYKFAPQTLNFFKKADQEGFGLSCRDITSVKVLRKENLKNVFMTGCPAWYDINKINQLKPKNIEKKYHEIIISDPAKPVNYDNALKLVSFLRNTYTDSKIIFVFHRSQDNSKNETCRLCFKEKIQSMGIEIRDISSNSEGFTLYDTCDLHIGFRVHAHIYNLSQGNKTILIEEDGRGAGVNQTLGLPQIKAYNDSFQFDNLWAKRFFKLFVNPTNNHLIEDVENHINIMEETNWQYISNALNLQKYYFKNMINFIKRLTANNPKD